MTLMVISVSCKRAIFTHESKKTTHKHLNIFWITKGGASNKPKKKIFLLFQKTSFHLLVQRGVGNVFTIIWIFDMCIKVCETKRQ